MKILFEGIEAMSLFSNAPTWSFILVAKEWTTFWMKEQGYRLMIFLWLNVTLVILNKFYRHYTCNSTVYMHSTVMASCFLGVSDIAALVSLPTKSPGSRSEHFYLVKKDIYP